MSALESTERLRVGQDGRHVPRPLRDFLFRDDGMPVLPWVRPLAMARPTRQVSRLAAATGVAELVLSLSGVALAAFMIMHLGLLSSVLLGGRAMDALAAFLERYYLLQAGVPFLLLLLVGHVLLAARKVPATVRQHRVLLQQMGRLRHPDTWIWALQLVSGVAVLVLASIHIWVILTGLPIAAAKSGERVFGPYLWLYLPFVLLVEGHITLGLYRVAVKWGLLSRRSAHIVLLGWTAVMLGLGFAILATFYRLGGTL